MAAYGAWRREGKTDKQAQANLLRLFKNVVVQDKSARDSLNTFMSGKGDVLLAYENEALFSKLKGLDVQYVIPRSTILIENPIAVTRTTEHSKEANAFLKFLTTPAAQQVFANNGYRPVVKKVLEKNRKKFPARPGEFTIDAKSIGGWAKAQKRFFDPEDRDHGEDRERRRWRHRLAPPPPSRGARSLTRTGPQRPCPSASSRCSSPSSSCCPSPPSCGRRRARARSPSGTPSPARRRWPRSSSRSLASLARLGAQRRAGNDHRVGARPRRLPRQVARERASSTSPSRCRRSSPG